MSTYHKCDVCGKSVQSSDKIIFDCIERPNSGKDICVDCALTRINKWYSLLAEEPIILGCKDIWKIYGLLAQIMGVMYPSNFKEVIKAMDKGGL